LETSDSVVQAQCFTGFVKSQMRSMWRKNDDSNPFVLLTDHSRSGACPISLIRADNSSTSLTLGHI
jgi:hypothetical protein